MTRKILSAAVWFAAITAAVRPAYRAGGWLAAAGVVAAAVIISVALWPRAPRDEGGGEANQR